MELKIYSPTEDGFIKKIEWNNEEIKKEVAERVEHYKGLVYTDAQIQDAKKDRANLRKFIEALESKRKEVKKQCLAPYEQFEKQVKEIVAIVNEPIVLIDKQIKEYEQIKRDEKLEKVQEFFAEVDFPEWVSFEKVYDTKWLNASVSLKSIKGAMEVMKEKIAKDLETLRILPEFGFEALEVYKTTLDINKALNEGKRLSEIQKRKAEHEAEQARRREEEEKRRQEAEFAKHMNPPVEAVEVVEEKQAEQLPEWICFKALLTTENALALKEFFDSRNIQFEAI